MTVLLIMHLRVSHERVTPWALFVGLTIQTEWSDLVAHGSDPGSDSGLKPSELIGKEGVISREVESYLSNLTTGPELSSIVCTLLNIIGRVYQNID